MTLWACSGERLPETARPEVAEELLDDIATPRHASDGGGQAWIKGTEALEIPCATPGRWELVYEAGPLGIRTGGALYFQVSPFWGWSAPQLADDRRLGYTEVSTRAEGLELEPEALGQGLLIVRVTGRDMTAGERIELVYGAGSSGALSDSYAERESRFWFAVDGDGDGVRGVLESSPVLRILPREPTRLSVIATSTVEPDGVCRVTVALLDAAANLALPTDARVELTLAGGARGGLELPQQFALEPGDGSAKTIELRPAHPGAFRLQATATLPGGEVLTAESNPFKVGDRLTRIWWGDLHGHSSLSDGTGHPEDYYTYARDVSALDFVALTDHDHFGLLALDQFPELYAGIQATARSHDEPGRFLALHGFEWTSWIHGHRHVVYFEDEGPLFSSLDAASDTPRELWAVLRGRKALSIPHHPAGGPIALDWSTKPDPLVEPLVEITSAHGSSESVDSPSPIYDFHAGNTARSALERGYRLGFIASGDSHDGHPGATHLGPQYGFRRAQGERGARMGNGGLVAVIGGELTRDSVLDALRARRAYATNGPRILLDLSLESHPMGATVAARGLPQQCTLRFNVLPTARIERIDLIRSGVVTELDVPAADWPRYMAQGLFDLSAGEYVYVRIVQTDGGMAWSSPIFFE